MSSFRIKSALSVCLGVGFAWLAATCASAQDVTSSTVQHGPSSFETQVKNAEVIYVEGNDLVIKVANGRVEHLVVPAEDKFHIDGQVKTVYDLKPGMKLTETITTQTTPRYVNTIRTLEGKVSHVQAPNSVIVTLPDNTRVQYRIPSHATFTVNGQEGKTAFDLRKGMEFKATIVKDEPWSIVDSTKHVVAEAPIPETPQQIGTLLIDESAPEVAGEIARSDTPVTTAKADPPPEELPDTASVLPLAGLVGLLAVGASLGLHVVRRKWAS